MSTTPDNKDINVNIDVIIEDNMRTKEFITNHMKDKETIERIKAENYENSKKISTYGKRTLWK